MGKKSVGIFLVFVLCSLIFIGIEVVNSAAPYCQDIDGDRYTPDLQGTCTGYCDEFEEVACIGYGDKECNDYNPFIHYGAEEICNSKDDDCDGVVDEGFVCPSGPDCPTSEDLCPKPNKPDLYVDYYWDNEICRSFTERCQPADECEVSTMCGGMLTCIFSTFNNEPYWTWVYDDDGYCDQDLITYYEDADYDNYGNITETFQLRATTAPEGYSRNGLDCDDSNSLVNPGVAENCTNGFDDNCNWFVDCYDNDCSASPDCVCDDDDGDGYGENGFTSCTNSGVDCDDRPNGDDEIPGNPDDGINIHPNANEVCGDEIDQDCSGADCLLSSCTDKDGDLYSIETNPAACSNVCSGQACLGGGDCDDDSSDDPTGCPSSSSLCNVHTGACAICTHPNALENSFYLCVDGVDNDCSREADYDGLPPNILHGDIGCSVNILSVFTENYTLLKNTDFVVGCTIDVGIGVGSDPIDSIEAWINPFTGGEKCTFSRISSHMQTYICNSGAYTGINKTVYCITNGDSYPLLSFKNFEIEVLDCIPDCDGKQCGADGCGEYCGDCRIFGEDYFCNSSSLCEQCIPNCEGRECGSDGCLGECGECESGEICEAGHCVEDEECGQYLTCMDFETMAECNNADFCKIGVINNEDEEDENIICGSVDDCEIGDRTYNSCKCTWIGSSSSGSCNFSYYVEDCDTEGIGKFGACLKAQQDISECDDPPEGLYISNWTGTWIWATENEWTTTDCEGKCNSEDCVSEGAYYHCNPEDAKENCEEGGQISINCPTEMPLPFFSKYNFIVAVLLIAGIYLGIVIKTKKH